MLIGRAGRAFVGVFASCNITYEEARSGGELGVGRAYVFPWEKPTASAAQHPKAPLRWLSRLLGRPLPDASGGVGSVPAAEKTMVYVHGWTASSAGVVAFKRHKLKNAV